MTQVLLIDDDRYIQRSVKELLEANRFDVSLASTAEEGFSKIYDSVPALLILDIHLPGEDGVSFCRRIRAKHKMPILMLTSKNEVFDKVLGLEVGADDYLTKPFDPRELLARVRALLRREDEYQEEGEEKEELFELDGLELDSDRWQVKLNGEKIELTATEFRLLEYMFKNVGRVLSRDQIFDQVWGYDESFNQNSLEVIVYRLRKKIEKPLGRRIIHTVRGYGYRLEGESG
ncbi:MAG: response regulator transcription factor [Fimbriimonadaceae bacterium]